MYTWKTGAGFGWVIAAPGCIIGPEHYILKFVVPNNNGRKQHTQPRLIATKARSRPSYKV
jgi:hypothetical protein